MSFEYDPKKSATNHVKHGVDFQKAQELWNDERRLIWAAKSDDEPRFAILAMIEGLLWVGFYTIRGENIRIISVRRARMGERKLYES